MQININTMTHLRPILFLSVLAFILCSCELETSSNGKLDGYWHIETIETIADGTSNDLSRQPFFWAFQGSLLVMHDRDGQHGEFVMHFTYANNRLSISDVMLSDRENGDIPQTDPTAISVYGVSRLDDVFTIERLDSRKMILASATHRLYFRRL